MGSIWSFSTKSLVISALLVASIAWHADLQAADLRLEWTDTSDNEEGFRIEHLLAGAFVEKVTTVGAGVMSYTDSALVAGNIYCYRLRAFNIEGESEASNQACGIAQEAPSVTPTVSTPQGPMIAASPTAVLPGGTVSASWSGIAAPTTTDWIGLYVAGAPDVGTSIDWMYVSCSKSASGAQGSGSCPFVGPTTAGTYELRLWSNDGYTRLATSSALIVSTQISGPIVVSTPGTGEGSGSSSSGAAQLPTKWTDYRLSVKLKSTDNDAMGVLLRYQDPNNYYRFVWKRQAKVRRIEKVQNGVRTVLGHDSVRYAVGQTYQLEITAQGQSLKVLIDGAEIFSVSDSSFAEGTLGLYSSGNQTTSFDDVAVEDLATGSVLLSEDFNDGLMRGWTVVDQNPSEGPSSWSAETGSLVQSSNVQGTFALYTLRNWTDYRLALEVRSSDNDSLGVMFRYQDNHNYYRFTWNTEDGFRRLEKVNDGLVTGLAEDSIAYVTGQSYDLEILAQGSTIEVRIDGSLTFSAQDSTLDRGGVALYSWYNQGSSFDNVVVEDLATGSLLLSENFNDGNLIGWTIVDQGTEEGPSAWSVESGALIQSGNLGSSTPASLGTYVLY